MENVKQYSHFIKRFVGIARNVPDS